MIERKIVVQLESGLHARPAAEFAKQAAAFASRIFIGSTSGSVNGKSIVGILSLAVKKGDEITLIADGADEQEALVAWPGKAEPLQKKPLPLPEARQFLREAESLGCYIKVYVDDHLYVQAATEETLRFAAVHRVAFSETGVGKLADITAAPLKIVLIDERIDQLCEQLRNWQSAFTFIRDAADELEIVGKGVNKKAGVAELCRVMGIGWRQVMAIGNEANDLELVQAAGVGVAMGNASERLKQAADLVTRTNDEQGVAHVLRQVLLSEQL
ncbi:HPr family phosphocarrier protein [Brevibacillus marinus]|uniref:HPr family phosphocarrier protein n=1 Tax=Brevibacillus marinus TaxID=2496837 RepID=UPI000F8499C9|nr:HPr family phosphocarrier protein [Brevibacillus marinus]